MWYKLYAHNEEYRYGWTENAAVAKAALAYLNRRQDIINDREGNPPSINRWGMEKLGNETDSFEINGIMVDLSRCELLFTDQTTVADFAPENPGIEQAMDAAGMRPGHLVKVADVTSPTVTRYRTGEINAPAAVRAIVFAWGHIPDSVKSALLRGEHLA